MAVYVFHLSMDQYSVVFMRIALCFINLFQVFSDRICLEKILDVHFETTEFICSMLNYSLGNTQCILGMTS